MTSVIATYVKFKRVLLPLYTSLMHFLGKWIHPQKGIFRLTGTAVLNAANAPGNVMWMGTTKEKSKTLPVLCSIIETSPF
jgi:hypothetical protein